MKPQKVRISLNRETIRELDSKELTTVAGGQGPTQAASCQSCPYTFHLTQCLPPIGIQD